MQTTDDKYLHAWSPTNEKKRERQCSSMVITLNSPPHARYKSLFTYAGFTQSQLETFNLKANENFLKVFFSLFQNNILNDL